MFIKKTPKPLKEGDISLQWFRNDDPFLISTTNFLVTMFSIINDKIEDWLSPAIAWGSKN